MNNFKKYSLITVAVACCLPVFLLDSQVAHGEESKTGSGIITFYGSPDEGIKDPENPDEIADPGPSPSTNGKLRIDFVPTLNFTSSNKISDKDSQYLVNAQLFLDETEARGNFIQITDERGGAQGWTLQLRQENQFENQSTTNSQLNGAVLSFDKSWTNSNRPELGAPLVSKEVIALDNIGSTYNLAEAKAGTGAGTWSISFGASDTNGQGQESTLAPKYDLEGNPFLDSTFNNKQVLENSAIKLSVPGATKKDPVAYSTVLTWLLAELP